MRPPCHTLSYFVADIEPMRSGIQNGTDNVFNTAVNLIVENNQVAVN